MKVVTIGKRLVPAEQIAYVEPFDPSANPEFGPEKDFKGRVVLLNRSVRSRCHDSAYLLFQSKQQASRNLAGELFIGRLPNRHRPFQATRSGFRQPHGAAAQVTFNHRNLNQSVRFKTAQIAGQRRLLKTGPSHQGTNRIIGSGSDMSQ
jgi:hypothetical protein